MAVEDLLPYLYSNAEGQQQRREQWWDAQRKQRIADNMASANQITRQLGYVNNITHALALLTDPNSHKIMPGHEAEAERLKDQLKQYNVPELTANLGQLQGFIQKLYDPSFNPETGMEQRSPLRALGEKLHLVKPQATPLEQPEQQVSVPSPTGLASGMTVSVPRQQPMTAGELIKGLQDIRQKYAIAPPGLEEGEKELASEEAQREAEGTTREKMDFIAAEGEKRGWSKTDIAEMQQAQAGGAKPTTPKPDKLKQVLVDPQGNEYEQFESGAIKNFAQEEISSELARTLKLVPKSAAGQKPVRAWSKDKRTGRMFSVLIDPVSNQIQPGSENYDILPPASMVGRISTGYFHFVGQDNLVHQVQETHTSGPNYGGAGTGAGPAKTGAGAGAGPSKVGTTPAAPKAPAATAGPQASATPVAPRQTTLGPAKPNAAQTAAQKDYDDVIELQTRANQVVKNKRKGLNVALEQHAIIEALQTATSRRFIMAAAQYLVNTNLANTFDQAMSQLSGTGELPPQVWKQVLQAVDDLRVGRKEKLRTSGLPVPETEDEKRKQQMREKLQQELNQPAPPPK